MKTKVDYTELATIAAKLNELAEDLTSKIKAIVEKLSNINQDWSGRDTASFVSQSQNHISTLSSKVSEIKDLSTKLSVAAKEYEAFDEDFKTVCESFIGGI